MAQNPVVTFEMEDGSIIKAELYPEVAPNTVNNFISLVKKGYTTRERSLDELFPWDFIDVGVTKEFLKREWNNSLMEKVTPNCRMQCSGCGAKIFGGGVCYEDQN